MSTEYSYYRYEGLPCRVAMRPLGEAECYVRGEGFVAGPKMTILTEGVPLSKAEIDALILGSRRAASSEA